MALTSDEVRHVALLTRIRLTEQEVELYRSQMDDILEHFQMLQELDTGQVAAHQSLGAAGHRDARRRDEALPGQRGRTVQRAAS